MMMWFTVIPQSQNTALQMTGMSKFQRAHSDFLNFALKLGISCKLFQCLISGKDKKNISLLSAEFEYIQE